jgi:hypothetical protein
MTDDGTYESAGSMPPAPTLAELAARLRQLDSFRCRRQPGRKYGARWEAILRLADRAATGTVAVLCASEKQADALRTDLDLLPLPPLVLANIDIRAPRPGVRLSGAVHVIDMGKPRSIFHSSSGSLTAAAPAVWSIPDAPKAVPR